MKAKKNNHAESLELLRNSDFSVKKLVTFNGHEGHGANADVYWKNRKVATFIDEGNGGEPYVYFRFDEIKNATDKWKSCKDFIASLPHYSLAEEYADSDYDWDETRKAWKANDVINALVHIAEEEREFKKTLRKVCGVKDGDVLTWKYKASEINKVVWREGKSMPLRECLKLTGVKCLNVLPQAEAFALLRKHG